MPFGIQNVTAVSLQNLTDIANVSSYPEFLGNVNNIIYEGYLFFILLWVMWIILFVAANQVNDQLLNNGMYSGAVISLLAFFLRAISVTNSAGISYGLLTDFQMWMFPIITII